MDSIIINGGKSLVGKITVNGSKNAALPIMTCALLSDKPLNILNSPNLTDIHTMKALLENHGAVITHDKTDTKDVMTINCNNITNFVAPYEIVRKMRASIWVLGPLLARFGEARVSLPGGCAIGARQVDLHIAVLKAMGANIKIENGYIYAKTKTGLKGTHFVFNKISVGATITGIMAAALARDETLLFNCAQEPEIVDVCRCLQQMGVKISGIGTSELKIIGNRVLTGTTYKVMPDRIEAGTYMIAAAITKGDIEVTGIDYHIVENLGIKLKEAGLTVEQTDNGVRVKYTGRLNAVDIQTETYPGFATDLQAQFMSLMTLCFDKVSIITENIFENRFMHVPELCRMGANITINGKNAIVRGVEFLSGAEVMASDLRASVSLILAGLAARGQTKVRRVYHLDRGYQNLQEKLTSCGADIYRMKGDSV